MKKCSRCKKSKVVEDFNFKSKAFNVRQKTCRLCTREQVKKHYHNNKEYYLNEAKARNKEIKNSVKSYIFSYLKRHHCVDCGESDPIVLDFDHEKGKIANVSDLVRKRHSLAVIVNEIKKCKVRCANCHRRKTARDFNWYKDLPL